MRFRGRQTLHALYPMVVAIVHILIRLQPASQRHTGTEGRGFVVLSLLLLLERLPTMTHDGLLIAEYIVMGRKLRSEPLTNAYLEDFLGTGHYATI